MAKGLCSLTEILWQKDFAHQPRFYGKETLLTNRKISLLDLFRSIVHESNIVAFQIPTFDNLDNGYRAGIKEVYCPPHKGITINGEVPLLDII
jgi:hypothetical protein